MKKYFLLIAGILCLNIVSAQTADKKWNIGIHGGSMQYNGDLGNDFYKTNQPFYGFGGLSFSRYIGTHFDINLLVTKGEIGHSENGTEGSFFSGVTAGTLNFRFNLTCLTQINFF